MTPSFGPEIAAPDLSFGWPQELASKTWWKLFAEIGGKLGPNADVLTCVLLGQGSAGGRAGRGLSAALSYSRQHAAAEEEGWEPEPEPEPSDE